MSAYTYLVRCPRCRQLAFDFKTSKCGECSFDKTSSQLSDNSALPTETSQSTGRAEQEGTPGADNGRPSSLQVSGGRPGWGRPVSGEVLVQADKGLGLPPAGLPRVLRRVP